MKRLRLALLCLLLLTGSVFYVLQKTAHAATLTWDGEGVTNNWSDCANWSGDVCPAGSGDTVIFDGTSSKNAVKDNSATANVATLNINSGYSGTVSLDHILTVTSSFSQAAGTFDAQSINLDINGTFSLSGGTFIASSGTTAFASTFTISGSGAFNDNSGTVVFDGTGSSTLTCNSATFNLVDFDHTGNVTKTVGSSCTLPLGNDPVIGGNNNADISLAGTLSGTGTLTLNTQGTGNTFTFTSGGTLSGFSGFATGDLTVSGATVDFGSLTTLDINDALIVDSSSVFTAPSATMTVAGAFTLASGSTFNANGGTLSFDGTTTATLACNSQTFNLVTFTHTTGVKTVNSNCSLPLGNDPVVGVGSNPDLTLNGTISGSGTLTIGDAVNGNLFTVNNAGVISGFSGISLGSFTVSNATLDFSSLTSFTESNAYTQTGGNVTFPNDADMNGSFTLNAGSTFNAPSGNLYFGSSISINASATFNANGGTITFDGGSNATLACGNAVFNSVIIDRAGSGADLTVGSDCNLPLGNNPTANFTGGGNRDFILNGTLSGAGTFSISTTTLQLNSTSSLSGFDGLVAGLSGATTNTTVSGASYDFGDYSTFDINGAFTTSSGATFTSPSGTGTIAGNFTIDPGTTFNANGGTVTFDGAAATISCDNATFNVVNISHTSSTKTISSDCSLPLGNNPDVSRAVTLNGTLSGSGTLTNSSGPLTINSGSSLSGFSGLSLHSFTVAGATADLSSLDSFVASSTLTLSSGTLTLPDGADLNLALSISGGTFNSPSGDMTLAGALTISGAPTFNANGGTFIFDGTSTSTLACNNVSFNLVEFSHTDGTKTVNSNCSLPLGNNPTVTGPVNLNGSLNGSGILTFDEDVFFQMFNGSNLSGFDTIDGSYLWTNEADVDFSAIDSINLTDSYYQYGGSFIAPDSMEVNGVAAGESILGFNLSNNAVFTAPSGTLIVNGSFNTTFTTANFTFNHNGGTIDFGGTDNASLRCENNVFNLVEFSHTDSTKTIESDCNLPVGNNPTLGGGYDSDIDVQGEISGTGTLSLPGFSSDLTLQDGGALDGFSGLNVGRRYIQDNTTMDFGSYNTFDIDGGFTLENAAIFTAPPTMTIGGSNFSVLDTSTFNHNNGTVVLDGSNQAIVGTTFNNLTKEVGTASTLTMPAGSTETILGELTLKGAFGQLLSLVSSSPGTNWFLDLQGTADVCYVSVTDSNNIGSTVTAYNSTSNSTNTGWIFSENDCDNPGGGGSSGGGSSNNNGNGSSNSSSSGSNTTSSIAFYPDKTTNLKTANNKKDDSIIGDKRDEYQYSNSTNFENLADINNASNTKKTIKSYLKIAIVVVFLALLLCLFIFFRKRRTS